MIAEPRPARGNRRTFTVESTEPRTSVSGTLAHPPWAASLADLIEQLPYSQRFLTRGMMRQRGLQFLPRYRFLALLKQRQPQVIAEAGGRRIPARKSAEGLDGAVQHALLQVNVADGIGEAGLSRNLRQGVLCQPKRLVQVAAGVGQKESRVVQSGSIIGVSFRDVSIERSGFLQTARARQRIGQIYGNAYVVKVHAMSLLVVGERTAMIALEIAHFSQARPQNDRFGSVERSFWYCASARS